MTIYLLYDPAPRGRWDGKPIENPSAYSHIELGGGSSSPPQPRIYYARKKAEEMQRRYFPRTQILPIELPV